MPVILVLWDVDHTLIETRGVGGEIYAEAFQAVTGHPLDQMPELAGRTEPVIFCEALKINDVADTGGLYGRFAAEQARGYANRANELRRRGRALPGTENALRALAKHGDVIQSVLTGNTRSAAETKLQAFGLDRYIDFDSGAYGTDDEARANLVKIARQHAEAAHGGRFDAASTVLIGDTPNDVTAAREGGARIIAIASGSNSTAELSDAGADKVFEDLTQTGELLSTIYGN